MGRKKKQRVAAPNVPIGDNTSATDLLSSAEVEVNLPKAEVDNTSSVLPNIAAAELQPNTSIAAVAAASSVSSSSSGPAVGVLLPNVLKGPTADDAVADDVYVSTDDECGDPTATNDSLYYSSDDDDNDSIEILLGSSKMGLMRKGALMIRKTQWMRGAEYDSASAGMNRVLDGGSIVPNDETNGGATLYLNETDNGNDNNNNNDDDDAGGGEDNIILDPAAKAARDLLVKQRQIELAKEQARRLESAENAGRDPCLFSKRTAFDIRMDQIEDRPWLRGDATDYFNYGLTEEDWVEYAERQLMVRQELMEAARQKRLPDPTVVPVLPKLPSKQSPRVAVVTTTATTKHSTLGNVDRQQQQQQQQQEEEEDIVIGPSLPPPSNPPATAEDQINSFHDEEDKITNSTSIIAETKISSAVAEGPNVKSIGGAWGAAAAPGSILAQLIEAQERGIPVPPPLHGTVHKFPPPPPPPPLSIMHPTLPPPTVLLPPPPPPPPPPRPPPPPAALHNVTSATSASSTTMAPPSPPPTTANGTTETPPALITSKESTPVILPVKEDSEQQHSRGTKRKKRDVWEDTVPTSPNVKSSDVINTEQQQQLDEEDLQQKPIPRNTNRRSSHHAGHYPPHTYPPPHPYAPRGHYRGGAPYHFAPHFPPSNPHHLHSGIPPPRGGYRGGGHWAASPMASAGPYDEALPPKWARYDYPGRGGYRGRGRGM
jgi:hypothetical protein